MSSKEEHYRKLENMYLGIQLNQNIYEQTQIHIDEAKAVIEMPVAAKYHHALGAMHGSVYFKLMDDAAFFAVNSLVEDYFVLTTSFNIHLVRPVIEGKIKAEGNVQFVSKSLFVAEARLYNEEGKELGFGTGNFVKSKSMLTEEIGYKL